MKTKVASLLVGLILITTQCMAQKQITVEAQNDDISNNLDLKAVATAFGESQNLGDFEQKLNDYDSGISNLDLNNDGQVDYLRVIEKTENDVHVVVIQAVLDKDVYQDVASIVVERDGNSNTTVQVIGDPYIYGNNYIIEPAYMYTPSIFSFFWGPRYQSWYSPYYWGYYPTYYHHRRPFELGIYLSNVYSHIDHNQRYYYTNSRRDSYAERLHNSIRRNDYGSRYPERNFSSRNENIRNKRDLEFNRNGVSRSSQTRSTYQGSNGVRSVRSNDNNGNSGWNQRNASQGQRTYSPSNGVRSSENNNATRVNTNQYRTNSNESGNRSNNNGFQNNSRTYSAPSNSGNSNVNNNVQRNNGYQQRVNTENVNRSNSVTRENTNSRPAPVVNQPARTVQARPEVQSQPQNTRSREVKSENRSSNSDSNRR